MLANVNNTWPYLVYFCFSNFSFLRARTLNIFSNIGNFLFFVKKWKLLQQLTPQKKEKWKKENQIWSTDKVSMFKRILQFKESTTLSLFVTFLYFTLSSKRRDCALSICINICIIPLNFNDNTISGVQCCHNRWSFQFSIFKTSNHNRIRISNQNYHPEQYCH